MNEQHNPLDLASEFETVTLERWRNAVERDLAGAPFEKKLITHTYEGIAIQPLYTKADHDGSNDPEGFPGQHRYTRGTTPLGSSRIGWDIRQEFAEPTPDAINEAVLADLAGGVTNAHLRFDLAARNGIEPDGPAADGYAASDGAMIYSLDDLDKALAGVELEIAGISLEAGAAALPAAAMVIALAERRGDHAAKLRIDFNADPLAVLARDGHHPLGLDAAFADAADLAHWSKKHAPLARALRVGTAPYHHAGATAAQDIAFCLATGVAYLRVLTNAGLTVDQAAQQLTFTLAVRCNFFLAAAKLRAARRLWDRVLTACGTEDPASRMHLHVKPSKRVITQRDPWVNILRNTACCFAASVAGAESVTTFPFDAAIADPDPTSRRLARNTQLILTEECNLHRVIDPAGGSYFVESLTDQLASKGWEIFQQIEAGGGMAESLRSGWIHEQIDSAFSEREKRIATRRDPITGVSEFPDASEKRPERTHRDLDALRETAAARLKQRPTDPELPQLLEKLASAKTGHRTNAAVRAARAGASIAELLHARHAAQPDNTVPIAPAPYAAPFETLRDAADTAAGSGLRPRVFLANLGAPAKHSARANFSRNFFEAGGFEVVESPPINDGPSAAEAFLNADANIACICSSDELYQQLVPDVAPALSSAGARTIILAGHPGANETIYRNAGVGRFIFIKCNVLQTLTELLDEEGVL